MSLIPNPLQSSALARPNHPALLCGKEELSWKALADASARRATALKNAGVTAGDVVALFGPPSVQWVVTWHAVGWLGAVAAPLPHDAPDDELRSLAQGLTQICDARGQLAPHLWCADDTSPVALNALTALPTLSSAQACCEERFWALDETRALLFTSGTGGKPRPVRLRSEQLLFSAFGSTIRLGHAQDDRWLCCLPLYHVGGLSILARCAWLGTTVVLHERFDAARVARELDEGKATLLSLVPTTLQRVLDARPARPFSPALRAILLGGEATSEALLEACRAINAPVALTWGMSEAASQVATREVGDLSGDRGSGPPQAFARVDVAEGDRLRVRGPLVEDGSLVSSDLGHIDQQGQVHVHGRADDMIISGGKLIAPEPIEEALSSHPALAEVAVVARDDQRWGQRPVAFYVLEEGVEAPSMEALMRHCGERLVSYKVPDAFVTRRALPRNRQGKLSRAALAADLRGQAAPKHLPVAESPPLTKLSSAHRLADLREWLADDLAAVEAEISLLLQPGGSVAKRAAQHLLGRPGKRVRPICTLLGARLGHGRLDNARLRQARELGLACELTHAATLLHDDVIDWGTERRGAPTARVIYGNTASVLGGNQLLTAALRRVHSVDEHDLLHRLLAVIDLMVEAEALQLEQQQRFDPNPATYNRIIAGKTASLFRWALEAGAMVAGLSDVEIESAGEVGLRLGLAFQLVDDVLDLRGDPAVLGKDALADLKQGKVTWPLLVALERDSELAPNLQELVEGDGAAEVGVDLVRRVLATGAVQATRERADAEIGRANAALARLPSGRARDALSTVAEYTVARVH
ncbi:MAG: polyprenyl synthetase family protein [Deltaproteobacteria bacterium]|nr:polyprenyl synthetase family protein [Deltaproteobacteria bacterium]